MSTIIKTGQKKWTNRHLNIHDFPIDDLYDLWNDNSGNLLADYNAMTGYIQQIMHETAQSGKQLRALGGGWSWTEIATVRNGIMLNTKPLNRLFTLTPGSVDPRYVGQPRDLLFAQCGTSILELNEFLEKRGRALRTSGASNGQTIAGAIGTGTHGAAINVGAIQDYVVGIHLIIAPDKHVWLERQSYPVTLKAFSDKLNAERIENDALFNAVLVSFGSCGFIHGVMIETDPLYLLECFRQQRRLDGPLMHIMQTLDFTNADLPYGSERPHHFQVFINPYEKDNLVFYTAMYKRPYQPVYPRQVTKPGKLGPGDDAPAFIGLMTDALPGTIPLIVNKMIGSTIKPFKNVWGTHGEIFNNFEIRGKVMSTALGVDIANSIRAKDVILSVYKKKPFAGILAMRFVKGTKATLGFTRFPHTCVLELDGVHSKDGLDFYEQVWDGLAKELIPFTFHWGKMGRLDALTLRSTYGDAAVNEWLHAQSQLLTDDMIRLFNNDQLVHWGLDQRAPVPLIV